MSLQNRTVTVRAPVNIAVIKYWGKKDENEIIPLNNSISASLHVDSLCATTTVIKNPLSDRDEFWLNGQEQSIDNNKRLSRCLQAVRALKNEVKTNFGLLIRSHNNFPTAAGLASSAAGYACLVSALGAYYDISDKKILSMLARQGSGSACRSVFGGFVEWHAGTDSSSSYAQQIVDENYWSEIRVVILVLNDSAKEVPSTGGMKRSVETSELLKYRSEVIVPKRCEEMRKAIHEKDFQRFAEITMRDSNQFHAICQDTYPPIFYLNQASKAVIDFVHQYNDFCGTNRLAYTFDAGPNACLFLLEKDFLSLMNLVNQIYPLKSLYPNLQLGQISEDERKLIDTLSESIKKVGSSVQNVIITRVGPGPEVKLTE